VSSVKLARLGVAIAVAAAVSACGGAASPDDPTKPRPPGQLTYQRFCISCHASGISGAPPIGNADAWAPRLAQGEEVLLRHTIDGMPSAGMPPKGMCSACTDQELRDAIHYMTQQNPPGS
jgi:cytochrome c5